MKTLIFNGSPRKNGNTKALINELIKHLEGGYKIIDAYHCNISPCIDCRYCWEHTGCSINDEWQEVDRYIKECDNIVIASPVYFSELTGSLLSIASRLQTYYCARRFRKEAIITTKKRGGIILVGGGDGNMATAIATATCLLKSMNAREINHPVCYHDTDRKPAIEDAGIVAQIRELAVFLNGITSG